MWAVSGLSEILWPITSDSQRVLTKVVLPVMLRWQQACIHSHPSSARVPSKAKGGKAVRAQIRRSQKQHKHAPVPLAPTTMRQKETPFLVARLREAIVALRALNEMMTEEKRAKASKMRP